MNNELLTTESQRLLIKSAIQTELLKRGFLAPIEFFTESIEHGNNTIQFHTDFFQTVPVIFKRMRISNFNSVVFSQISSDSDGDSYQKVTVVVSVNIAYVAFDGGRNSTKLFDFSVDMAQGENDIFNIKTH